MASETTAGSPPRKLQRLVPVAAILALAAGLWLGLSQFQSTLRGTGPIALSSGTLLPNPRPLEPFTLTGGDGEPFTLENLKGAWHFLAIGYTHCPDVCPTTMATFDAVAKLTGKQGATPGFLFVSVDPERDSPEKLRQYVSYFNEDFLAATGPHPALQGLSAQLGLLYGKAPEQDSAMGYLVDHSASIMLIDPLGRLAAIFSAPHDPAAMANDFKTISH
jgi:protein SCO1/2